MFSVQTTFSCHIVNVYILINRISESTINFKCPQISGNMACCKIYFPNNARQKFVHKDMGLGQTDQKSRNALTLTIPPY